ncbi:unnamed protein product [Nyctereutes procyonoides]|uniref:(raccoon dog) hypothetical protein n=1 Tax=Nyctereutes procyonoides TaxID=34880 RepID=A0A811Y357_NYCPR|nr:unnamed protein product [Nyctereutes procyonoides]
MPLGMAVSDGVIKVFNDMKVQKSSTPEEVKKHKKAVLFCLSEDKKDIILEEGKEILVGNVGQNVDNPYATFVKMLPVKDCCYALYDATYRPRRTRRRTWIKHELQANCDEEVKDRCTLAEKLGGSTIISLEGKPL